MTSEENMKEIIFISMVPFLVHPDFSGALSI
jgi:hypothetical protein